MVWPIEPIPESLQMFIQKTIQHIADEANWDLKFVSVHKDLLHVLVGYMADQPSSWFVELLKNEIEQEIEIQYGLSIKLWKSGYFASPAVKPLTEIE